jgi:hypothetical protein
MYSDTKKTVYIEGGLVTAFAISQVTGSLGALLNGITRVWLSHRSFIVQMSNFRDSVSIFYITLGTNW